MARIYPFRALRYNPSMVRVEEVVTQPYDKITPAMQQAYYQRSLYNLVRVILGLPELFDEPGSNDVYTRAARDFADWRRMGVLAQEKDPCIFAYSQRFTVPGGDGEVHERRAFIGLGEVCDYSAQVVKRLGHDLELKGNFTYENYLAPVYLSGKQTVTNTSFQLTWYPTRKVSF